MVLYKSDCESNHCELPSEQATPPTLAREVWPVRLKKEKIAKNISKALVLKHCVSGFKYIMSPECLRDLKTEIKNLGCASVFYLGL